jgi:hypothetical protein
MAGSGTVATNAGEMAAVVQKIQSDFQSQIIPALNASNSTMQATAPWAVGNNYNTIRNDTQEYVTKAVQALDEWHQAVTQALQKVTSNIMAAGGG